MKYLTAFLLFYFLFHPFVFCQNGSANLCINAEPLCALSGFYYPNTSGINYAEDGPDYGCLQKQYNPSWFYLQIEQSGNIQLMIEQSTSINGEPDLDVDFIIYGPFNDPKLPCTSDLTSSNIIDCSYEPEVIEFVDILTAIAGEYYLLLITNFSRESGYISVTQTAGPGTTSCGILVENFACEGELLTLDATTTNATNYIWYKEDSLQTDNYIVINGENSATLDIGISGEYKAEAYDLDNNLIERYLFDVIFFQAPEVPDNIQEYTICDNFGDNDGIGEFDLDTMTLEILNGLNPFNFSVSYYNDLSDASSGINQLPLLYINILPTEVIYTRIDNISFNDVECFDIGTFNIVVNLLPVFDLEEEYILCVNTNGTEEITTPPIIDTGLDMMNYGFIWHLNAVELPAEVASMIIPTQDGIYSVEATNLTTGCSNTITTMVNLSSPPVISASVTSFAFSNNHTLEASATGSGYQEYEFSLDGGAWQDNGTFNDVSFGEHIITARDINGCGESSTTVMVIDYPLYFTPNGDGYHDTWNIDGLAYQQLANIYLFDRYGKLLKQLSPMSSGWDGTYNGAPLPSSDYWFTVEYREPRDSTLKIFKAHFTLKR